MGAVHRTEVGRGGELVVELGRVLVLPAFSTSVLGLRLPAALIECISLSSSCFDLGGSRTLSSRGAAPFGTIVSAMREQVSFEVSAPARRGTARVAPERQLAWAEWGPADGAPVLFSPGAATSCSLGFAGGALERLGARLIAVDRPGDRKSVV